VNESKTRVKERQVELDFLRGVAILSVVVCHIGLLSQRKLLSRSGQTVVDLIANTGWMGVDLFFVLSGFLISGLLFREHIQYGKIDVGRFFIRRGLKIYPAFYALIIITVISFWIRNMPIDFNHLAAECLFVQNYFTGFWGHTWTLAIEEQFYLGLAIFLACVGRFSHNSSNPYRLMPCVFACVMTSALVSRFLTIRTEPYPYMHTYTYTHCRIDSLMFGVLLSYYWCYHTQRLQSFVETRTWLLAFLALGCFVALKLPRSQWWISSVGYSLIWLGWGCILLILCCNPHRSALPQSVLKSLAPIGRYSYSIYLWHAPVLWWGEPLLRANGLHPGFLPCAAGYIAISLVVGILLAKIIELPVLKLRDRIFPSRTIP